MSVIQNNLHLVDAGASKKNKSVVLRASLVFLVLSTIVTGIAYPFTIAGLAQLIFPEQAQGSLLREKDGTVGGSRLLAQDFSLPRFFHARPSAANYGAIAGAASNQGPGSAKLKAQVQERRVAWIAENGPDAAIPPEMLYASGSGLDSDISLAAALLQLQHVATARGLNPQQSADLENMVHHSVAQDGVPRVNVTVLNWNLEHDTRFGGTR